MGHEDYLAVIAMDVGTTFSGYAFSMRTDQQNIKMNKSWGAEVGFQAYKTPTTLLLKPDGSLHSFGFEAETEFSDLDEEDLQTGHQLFQRFKMELYGQKKLDSSLEIKSTSGTTKSALDVFAMAISFMKTHCFEAMATSGKVSGLCEGDIRWVITVPAIWSDTAKKFMRMAAKQAGLVQDVFSPNLVIALEPEAASLYCRMLPLEKFKDLDGQEEELSFRPGDTYIIVDCGGGTVDITVHELTRDMKVREVKSASGGPWGGMNVDRKYYDLLGDIFGTDFINKLKRDHPTLWLNMMVDFEIKKRSAKPENANGINVALFLQFSKEFEKQTGEDVIIRIKQKKHLGVKFSNGMLRISGDTFRGLYSEIFPHIKDQLRKLLRESNDHKVTSMFLVGGFAESAYLQDFLITEFGWLVKLLIPEEAGMAVMKGSVLFGHDSANIVSRIARTNYCFSGYRNFHPGTDKPSQTVLVEGEKKYFFLKRIVKQGQRVKVNEVFDHILSTKDSRDTKFTATLCCTDDDVTDDPRHPSVQDVETISVESPNVHKKNRRIKVSLKFGGTDILFKAVDLDSGNEVVSTVHI